MCNSKTIRLTINGRKENLFLSPQQTLLQALRDNGHVDVKHGCGKGDCGACAVLVDGLAVDSCLTLAWLCEDKEVTTVAGIGNGTPHPLHVAFRDLGAAQCGFCTPGMIVAAKGLLDDNPNPDDNEIRLALSGNLCRCTGYVKIVEAVQVAARVLREEADLS
ncbi:(2Fe-2S)-binding protein [Shimia gijangensis]|nr:(2Fe-2S)-binding protein [Shimia gijangensis]